MRKYKIFKRPDLYPQYIVAEKRWWGWKFWGKYVSVPTEPLLDSAWRDVWQFKKFKSSNAAEKAIIKKSKHKKEKKVIPQISVKELSA